MNHCVALAVAEKVSALNTIDDLRQRAARADVSNFDRVLDRLPELEPDVHDRLPSQAGSCNMQRALSGRVNTLANKVENANINVLKTLNLLDNTRGGAQKCPLNFLSVGQVTAYNADKELAWLNN